MSARRPSLIPRFDGRWAAQAKRGEPEDPDQDQGTSDQQCSLHLLILHSDVHPMVISVAADHNTECETLSPERVPLTVTACTRQLRG